LATAAGLFVANLKLMLQGSYFEVSTDSQPFLHFWSLSVEEQFYLIFPFAFVHARKRFSRTSLLIGLGGLTLLSFLGCLKLMESSPTWAFYLLPTRAWELLVGAVLAVAVAGNDGGKNSHPVDMWLSVCGFVLIVVSLFFTSRDNFPGLSALIPVVGTALLIGLRFDPAKPTERLLVLPWLVWIGKRSYSLYLWHWPVYCFVDYCLYERDVTTRLVIKVVTTVVLSLASFSVFEMPVRVYLNHPIRKTLCFIAYLLSVSTLTLAGLKVRAENYVDSTVAAALDGGIGFYVSDAAPDVVLMGDSNASMYGALFGEISALKGINVNVISVAGGDPFEPSPLYTASMGFLSKSQPEITVFAAAWSKTVQVSRERVASAVNEILKYSKNIVLVTQPPVLPASASRESFRKLGRNPVFEDPDVANGRLAANAYLKSLASANSRVHVIDIESLFVSANGQVRFTDNNGRQLFQDRMHISGNGAELVKSSLILKMTELCDQE
jgi:hypothetical protein